MALVDMVAVPGRSAGTINGHEVEGLAARCPYCSRMHDEFDYEKGEPLKIPSRCERCGSPMEPGKKAEQFNADRANERPTSAYRVERTLDGQDGEGTEGK